MARPELRLESGVRFAAGGGVWLGWQREATCGGGSARAPRLPLLEPPCPHRFTELQVLTHLPKGQAASSLGLEKPSLSRNGEQGDRHTGTSGPKAETSEGAGLGWPGWESREEESPVVGSALEERGPRLRAFRGADASERGG